MSTTVVYSSASYYYLYPEDAEYKANPVVDDLQHEAEVAAIERKLVSLLGVKCRNNRNEVQDNREICSYCVSAKVRRNVNGAVS